MLALLGLVGLALAGTAFVGFPTDEEDGAPDTSGDAQDELEFQAQLATSTDLLTDEAEIGTNETFEAGLRLATEGNDVLDGTDGNDVFDGFSGDDYMNGGDGDDTLTGGDGVDQMHGGAGDDTLAGDGGDDLVWGYVGNDTLSGDSGDDKLHGGDGADVIDGGMDDDELLGGFGDDTLIGGAGRDMIQGSEGDDVIDGVTGEELGAERDYLNGSEGNDHLIGNNSDVMSGGEGADRFEITDGNVSIMDYEDDDMLVVLYDGEIPVLETQTTSSGITLLANGTPVASLYGLTSFDISTVELVAA